MEKDSVKEGAYYQIEEKGVQMTMEFTNFTTLVREEVERRTGDNYRVRINDVRKNNGVVLRGLTVMQDDSNISPTIYLNNYYEDYANGRATFVNVVNDVMDTYHRNKVNQSVDMRCFLNYESVKHCVVYKLVNTEKNKELLADIPHMEFLDLSIVFQCMIARYYARLRAGKMGSATMTTAWRAASAVFRCMCSATRAGWKEQRASSTLT